MAILLKPVITEKMTAKGTEGGQFGFIVDKHANKIQIKDAVEELYNVQVVAVNTMNYPGKSKSSNTKTGIISGRTNAYKKAIVTLAEGETIDFFSNI